MKHLPGYLDLFISPVTGNSYSQNIALEKGYTLIGDKNGNAVPVFTLVDLKIDIQWLQKMMNVITKLPLVLTKKNVTQQDWFPNAQILQNLSGDSRRMLKADDNGLVEIAVPMVDYIVFNSDGNLDILNHSIINLLDPINPSDAATKAYVDAHVSDTEITATGEVTGYKPQGDTILPLSLTNSIAFKNGVQTWVNYGPGQESKFSNLTTLTGAWNCAFTMGAVNGNNTVWLNTIGDSNGNFSDFDISIGNFIRPEQSLINYNLSNDIFSFFKSISMGGLSITNLANPINLSDAATKNYVDNLIYSLNVGVTSITAGTGITANGVPGASITSSGTLALSNTGVTSGNYIYPTQVQVNAQGRIQSITSGAQPVQSVSGASPNIVISGTTANPIVNLSDSIHVQDVEITNGGVFSFSSFGGLFDASNANQAIVPSGNTLSRPTFPLSGSIRVNTLTGQLEYCYDNASWVGVGSSYPINITGSVIGSGNTGLTPINVLFNKDQQMSVTSDSATGYYGFNFNEHSSLLTKRLYKFIYAMPDTGTGAQNSTFAHVYANGNTSSSVSTSWLWNNSYDLGGNHSLYYVGASGFPNFLINAIFNSTTEQFSTTWGGNLSVTGSLTVSNGVDTNNKKIINVADAVSDTDAVNYRTLKNYDPTGSILVTNTGPGSIVFPPLAKKFKITLIGAGGGGGNSSTNDSGSGAGSGATVIAYFTYVANATYYVGKGGAAQTNGEATMFTINGITLSASGGAAGVSGSTNNCSGGIGGIATQSLPPSVAALLLNGTGGGAGNNKANLPSGHGGSSSLGGGGPSVNVKTGSANGIDGAPNTGSGASGGTAGGTGGKGADGLIIIEYW